MTISGQIIVNDIRNCTLSVPAKAEIMAFIGLQAQFLMSFIIRCYVSGLVSERLNRQILQKLRMVLLREDSYYTTER